MYTQIYTYIRTHTRAKSDPQVSTQGSVRQESNCASRSSSSSSAIWHTGRAARAARRKARRCGGAEVDVHQTCESIRHARAPDTQEHQTCKSITYARASNTHRDRQGVGGRGEIEEGDLGGLHAPVCTPPAIVSENVCRCMHVCLLVCMYVWLFGCLNVCMFVCMHECMYVCMHACMHACIYACAARPRPLCRGGSARSGTWSPTTGRGWPAGRAPARLRMCIHQIHV